MKAPPAAGSRLSGQSSPLTRPAAPTSSRSDQAEVGLKTRPRSAGSIKRSQLRDIAEKKMKDLNANDVDAAARIIEGSARSMGLEIVEA